MLGQTATNSGGPEQTGDLGLGFLDHRGERFDGSPGLCIPGLLDLFHGAGDLEGADADRRALQGVGGRGDRQVVVPIADGPAILVAPHH